jgi:hypothetical protein
MRNKRVAYLETRSWIGYVAGASHYLGMLWCNGKEFELQRKIDKEEAIQLNKEFMRRIGVDGAYSPGDYTNGFLSREHLLKVAIKEVKKQFPDALVLIESSHVVCSFEPVVWAKDRKIKTDLNKLYKKAEKIGFFDGGREKDADLIDKEWKDILNKYIEENENT